jgi:hypothetical protein
MDCQAIRKQDFYDVIEKYRANSTFTSFFGRQYYIFSNTGIGSILNNDLLELPSSGEDLGVHWSRIDVLK